MGLKVIVAGASGLVGQHYIRQLANKPSVDTVYSLGRTEISGLPDKVEQFKAPTLKWSSIIAGLQADIACSCLGSTIKKAGSQAEFAKIDLDLVHEFFSAAKEAGVKQAISISSPMADASNKAFYLRIKGQAEGAIKTLKFDRVDIIRPGLLKGKRTNDTRFVEQAAIMAGPVFNLFMLGKYRVFRAIDSKEVAKAMVALSQNNEPGWFIHNNDSLLRLSGE